MQEKAASIKQRILSHAIERNGVKLFVFNGEGNLDIFKDIAFQIKGENPKDERACFIAGIEDHDKCGLIVALSDALVADGWDASRLVKSGAKHIQGGGGGQPHFATAGGKKKDGLNAAVETILEEAGLK